MSLHFHRSAIIHSHNITHAHTNNFAPCTVQVSDDAKTLVSVGNGGGVLAGSCCSMVEVFHNLVNVLNVPLGEAVAMLAENPARSVCVDLAQKVDAYNYTVDRKHYTHNL